MDAEPDDGQDLLFSMLDIKKNELIEKAKHLDLTLKQLHADITQLEAGSDLLSYLDQIDVQLVHIEPMRIVSIREKVNLNDLSTGYGPFFNQLYRHIVGKKLTTSGKPMTIYHSPEYTPSGYDIEFAIPVQDDTANTTLFQSGLCVKSVLKGHYSALPSIYAKQHEWAQTEGYKFIGAPFEIYITDPYMSISPEDQITEIYYPIKPILNE
ncbi:Bacterial transcription activator, effector binding domain [compost metagenome]